MEVLSHFVVLTVLRILTAVTTEEGANTAVLMARTIQIAVQTGEVEIFAV